MTGVFETQTFQVCPTEPIIEGKEELLHNSPNLSYDKLSLPSNIICNFKNPLVSGEQPTK
jgi:hypothetical protein